jgi:triacylglycerol lipase
MPADTMNPATAVTWGLFIQAAFDQYASDPGQINPAAIKNMPAGYTLVRTIQMSDFLGPQQSRAFYGFIAVGGDPKTAVVAVRGTATTTEWWDDLHWDMVPFTQVPNGGNVAQGFFDIYDTFGTMTPGQQQGTQASSTFAADVAHAVAGGLGHHHDLRHRPAHPQGGRARCHRRPHPRPRGGRHCDSRGPGGEQPRGR